MYWRARIEGLFRQAAEQPGIVPLGGGFPAPHLMPIDEFAQASSRALRRLGERVLQYDWPEGREDLRTWIAERLSARGADVRPEDVLVTSGAQQALAIAAELLLVPGAEVDMDATTYPGAIEIFTGRQACPRVRPCGQTALHYRMPWLRNPTGELMGKAERRALLVTARAIVEDEAYAELGFEGAPGRPLLAEDREKVWLVGSLSKTLSPGLRMGWLVPPRAWMHDASELKKLQDLQSNGLAQAVLMEFLSQDDFDLRLASARRYYARQAARLMAGVAKHLPDWRFTEPRGGFSLWLEAPEADEGIAFLETAIAHGVTFDPGRMFQPMGRDKRLTLRACFSGVSEAQLDEGASRLGAAWKAHRRGRRHWVSSAPFLT